MFLKILHIYNTIYSVVDGGWSSWTNGSCSKTCGGGTLTATRRCDNPTPTCLGKKCSGLSDHQTPCNTHCCSGNMFVPIYVICMYLDIRGHCTLLLCDKWKYNNYSDTVNLIFIMIIIFQYHNKSIHCEIVVESTKVDRYG